MLAIGLACFSILGGGREALYNKPGSSNEPLTDLEHNRAFPSRIDEAGASGKSFL